MFSGGTNWGFEAGLHADGSASFQTGPYVPGGPLTEAGDASPYFGPVCAAVSEVRGLPAPAPPPPAPKSHYMGALVMTDYATLWDALPLLQQHQQQQVRSAAGPQSVGMFCGRLFSLMTPAGWRRQRRHELVNLAADAGGAAL